MTAYSSLAVHLKTNMSFKLLPEMNWSIEEIEGLPPLEREAYLAMAREFIEKRNQQRKQQ